MTQGHTDLSLTTARVCHKSKEVFAVANPKYGILRARERQRLDANDSSVTRSKSKETDFNIKTLIASPKANILKVATLIGALCSTAQTGPFCIYVYSDNKSKD